jgi:hypothetical protein
MHNADDTKTPRPSALDSIRRSALDSIPVFKFGSRTHSLDHPTEVVKVLEYVGLRPAPLGASTIPVRHEIKIGTRASNLRRDDSNSHFIVGVALVDKYANAHPEDMGKSYSNAWYASVVTEALLALQTLPAGRNRGVVAFPAPPVPATRIVRSIHVGCVNFLRCYCDMYVPEPACFLDCPQVADAIQVADNNDVHVIAEVCNYPAAGSVGPSGSTSAAALGPTLRPTGMVPFHRPWLAEPDMERLQHEVPRHAQQHMALDALNMPFLEPVVLHRPVQDEELFSPEFLAELEALEGSELMAGVPQIIQRAEFVAELEAAQQNLVTEEEEEQEVQEHDLVDIVQDM